MARANLGGLHIRYYELIYLTIWLRRFKYNPNAVRNVLFPGAFHDTNGRPQKKPRLSDSNVRRMDVDGEPSAADAEPAVKKSPSIIIETSLETFLIAPQNDDSPEDKGDKENAADITMEQSRNQKYTISLVRVSKRPPEDTPVPLSNGDVSQDSLEEAKADAPQSNVERPKEPPVSEVASEPATITEPAAKQDTEVQETESTEPGTGSTGPAGASQATALSGQQSVEPSTAETKVTGVEAGAPMVQEGSEPTTDKPNSPTPLDNPSSTPGPATSSDTVKPPTETAPLESEGSTARTATAVQSKGDTVKPTSYVRRKEGSSKRTTTLEVLQRNVSEDQFLFDDDGIGILTDKIEDGMRKGWKIEARSWRRATNELTMA